MKTVYIFAPFDPIPGESGYPARYGALKHELEQQGHRCVWWTSDWDHTKKIRRQPGSGGGDVRLLPTLPYRRNVGLQRVRSHRALARAYVDTVGLAIDAGELPAPDVQLFALPTLDSAAACQRIKQRYGGKVVLDVMDIWPDTFYQALPLGHAGFRRWAGRLLFAPFVRQARFAATRCDALTAQSRRFVEWARGMGFSGRPVHMCYLGSDIPTDVAIRVLAERQTLRLAYIGMMGMSYDLEALIEGVRQLVAEGHAVSLDIAGSGPKEQALREQVRVAGMMKEVRFHGHLEKSKLSKLLAACHLGVVPMFPESGVVVPYKACEYSCLGLGMIHSLPGELEALVGQYGAGCFYRSGDLDSLKSAIRSYLEAPEQVAAQSGGALALARAVFERRRTFRGFAEFLVAL